jgi:hypothetical protein
VRTARGCSCWGARCRHSATAPHEEEGEQARHEPVRARTRARPCAPVRASARTRARAAGGRAAREGRARGARGTRPDRRGGRHKRQRAGCRRPRRQQKAAGGPQGRPSGLAWWGGCRRSARAWSRAPRRDDRQPRVERAHAAVARRQVGRQRAARAAVAVDHRQPVALRGRRGARLRRDVQPLGAARRRAALLRHHGLCKSLGSEPSARQHLYRQELLPHECDHVMRGCPEEAQEQREPNAPAKRRTGLRSAKAFAAGRAPQVRGGAGAVRVATTGAAACTVDGLGRARTARCLDRGCGEGAAP